MLEVGLQDESLRNCLKKIPKNYLQMVHNIKQAKIITSISSTLDKVTHCTNKNKIMGTGWKVQINSCEPFSSFTFPLWYQLGGHIESISVKRS